MPESFGARLRQRREEQEIDLRSIAEQTKIKLSLLEALERDDVSHWPSGIFRRAYIRTYAHIIGLDPDVVLREFLEVHPEPADVFSVTAAAALEEAARRNGPPPTRLRTIVDSAIDSLARLRRPGAIEEPAPAG
ncbi:MAG: helix-turn-helix domain-containing protein, partial [Vicinamibacterales bacterium]